MAIKTLHLTNAYHPTSGGIRTFYQALLRRADERGRAMRLIVPGDANAVQDIGGHGRIYFVRARPAPAFDRRYRMVMPPAYLRHGGAVTEILRAERPDLVEICDKYSLFYLAALLRKGLVPHVPRPALLGVSCERMDDNMRAYVAGKAIAKRFTRWYLRHVYGPPFDCHVANSDYTADELRQALWDRAPDFVRVCPMGVDVDHFGPGHRDEVLRHTLLERAGGTRASVLLLYVGRLSPEKNVDLLVRMMACLDRAERRDGSPGPDYRLIVVGDGPLFGELQATAPVRSRQRVLLVGAVTSASLLRRYYASADVFVHPNPREPFGIAPLEAMASGVPLVAANGGGVREYAKPDNAWLAAPEPEAFAVAVRSVVECFESRRVTSARATASRFAWPQVADRWFSLYDQVANEFRILNRTRAS
jgi:glycosyltransferase involved in cell wall biosynthesis